MGVGLLIVSHSSKLAEGVVELAAQMGPSVQMRPAGGTDAGGIGTSLQKITAAVQELRELCSGVLVLCDLGSAVMTSEAALEFAGHPEDVQLADAPLVEGAVSAAVAAEMHSSLEHVKAAAESALHTGSELSDERHTDAPVGSGQGGRTFTATVTLVNPMGLHARPAATLAAALGEMDTDVDVDGVDGQSVMMLMTLGAKQGHTLTVEASGPDAQRAIELIRNEVESGFGEL